MPFFCNIYVISFQTCMNTQMAKTEINKFELFVGSASSTAPALRSQQPYGLPTVPEPGHGRRAGLYPAWFPIVASRHRS